MSFPKDRKPSRVGRLPPSPPDEQQPSQLTIRPITQSYSYCNGGSTSSVNGSTISGNNGRPPPRRELFSPHYTNSMYGIYPTNQSNACHRSTHSGSAMSLPSLASTVRGMNGRRTKYAPLQGIIPSWSKGGSGPLAYAAGAHAHDEGKRDELRTASRPLVLDSQLKAKVGCTRIVLIPTKS